MEIYFDEKAPIYLQIVEHIKMEIVAGRMRPGERMPSVREMAVTAKVNPNTVQRVYQELEREGVTITQRGTGSFITEDQTKLNQMKDEMSLGVIRTFADGMKRLGLTAEEILDRIQNYLEVNK